jgi:hypothetical protein
MCSRDRMRAEFGVGEMPLNVVGYAHAEYVVSVSVVPCVRLGCGGDQGSHELGQGGGEGGSGQRRAKLFMTGAQAAQM